MVTHDRNSVATRFYISVRVKFVIAFIGACLWTYFSLWMAENWIRDLSELIGSVAAIFFIFGIAIIPGFMNSFAALVC